MTEQEATPFGNKVFILSDLWREYSNDEEMSDFFRYNNLGLPLAYCVDTGVVSEDSLSKVAKSLIEETFNLLLGAMGIEDEGFENLDDLLTFGDKGGNL